LVLTVVLLLDLVVLLTFVVFVSVFDEIVDLEGVVDLTVDALFVVVVVWVLGALPRGLVGGLLFVPCVGVLTRDDVAEGLGCGKFGVLVADILAGVTCVLLGFEVLFTPLLVVVVVVVVV